MLMPKDNCNSDSNSNSLTKIIETLDLLNINQAVFDGILIDLNVVFSEYYKINMEILKLNRWKLLITKKAFDRYIDAENNFMAGILREDKSKRFCEIIFYLYAKLKDCTILASDQTSFILEIPISVPQWDCPEAVEKQDPDPPGCRPICSLKVLIKRQTNHLILILPNEN